MNELSVSTGVNAPIDPNLGEIEKRTEILPPAALQLPKIEYDRVTIVGAGLAGLTCAYALKQQGIIARVYEASPNRIGGRVWTDNTRGPLPIERGGELINTNHRALRQLAAELGVELIDLQGKPEGFRTALQVGKSQHTAEELVGALEPLMKRIEIDLQKLTGRGGKRHAKTLDNTSLDEYVQGAGVKMWAFRMLSLFFKTELGRETCDQSALVLIKILPRYVAMFRPQGDFSDDYGRYVAKGGMSTLIRALEEKLTGQIVRGTKLTRVARSGDHFELTFARENSTETIDSDLAVLAIPYSTLRKVELREAKLPPVREAAIHQLGHATHSKIHVFGSTSGGTVRDVHEVVSKSLHGFVWNERRREDAEVATLRTLLVGGYHGARVPETLPRHEERSLRRSLDRLFPGKHDGPVTVTNWAREPHSRGSYSCPRRGQVTALSKGLTPTDTEDLYYVGEHVSRDFGFMIGAVESGLEVAQLIAHKLTKAESARRAVGEQLT